MKQTQFNFLIFLMFFFSIMSMSQSQHLSGLPNTYELDSLNFSNMKFLFDGSDVHDNYDGYENFFSWEPNDFNKTVFDYLCKDNYAHTEIDTIIYYDNNKAVVVLSTVEFRHFSSGGHGRSGCHACSPKYNFIVFKYFRNCWSPLLYGVEWTNEGSWGYGPQFGFEVIDIGKNKYALKSDEHDGNQGYNYRSIRLFLLESGIPEIFEFNKDHEFWCFLDEYDENNEMIYHSNSCSKYLYFYQNKNSDYYNIRLDISNNDNPCKVLGSSYDCDDNIEFYEFSSIDKKYILLDTLNVIYQNNLLQKIKPVIVHYHIQKAKSDGYDLVFKNDIFNCNCEKTEDSGRYCAEHLLDETYLFFPEVKIIEKHINNDGFIDYVVNYTIEGYYGGNGYTNYNATILGGSQMIYLKNDSL